MLPRPPRVILYSAFADAALAVRAAIAGADAVLAKTASPRALLAVLRGELRPPLDPRALRAAGERLDPEDLPILGMLTHGVAHEEIARTLAIDPEWLVARRWAMLARLAANRRAVAA
jgi:DNA-binding NarL/FixJ family response regulator